MPNKQPFPSTSTYTGQVIVMCGSLHFFIKEAFCSLLKYYIFNIQKSGRDSGLSGPGKREPSRDSFQYPLQGCSVQYPLKALKEEASLLYPALKAKDFPGTSKDGSVYPWRQGAETYVSIA
ncbi:hypothetical protein [Desulfocastanea catecholica]